MSKPGGDPSSGISSGDALRLPERHPACRRREAQPGSCAERENLHGDAKEKGTSGANREAESTDAPVRGGLLRSSGEAGECPERAKAEQGEADRTPIAHCDSLPASASIEVFYATQTRAVYAEMLRIL